MRKQRDFEQIMGKIKVNAPRFLFPPKNEPSSNASRHLNCTRICQIKKEHVKSYLFHYINEFCSTTVLVILKGWESRACFFLNLS